ncbi:large ribosomal subunit protein mL44 isoform X1 [Musca vetustissima]|uniref:large ribosomal subunit protein mL44 isoform X1 n=1 Tax=Musca vetustissima TaxID=27455 RepID=UPI002AB72310|nr:large ribosomal subunit protein mL44 isoform X1 [Musca vetustissima]
MSMLRSSVTLLNLSRALIPKQNLISSRSVKRWVAPTLRELNRRSKKLGPQQPQPRSGFVEWNYRAELFAFGKRLQEEFQIPLLQTAFTQQSYIAQEELKQRDLGIENVDIQLSHNHELSERGEHIIKEYVDAFIGYSLPKVPAEGRKAIASYLLSTEILSNVALNLGMKELLLDAEYPPSTNSMSKSLKAVVGALEQSSGMERAFLFVRDFVCTQLNQKDILELWNIENPEDMLKQQCQQKKLPAPEPRLLGDCGKNTVLSAYHVGLYCNKTLIGKGFGEDIPTAVKTASLDALQTMFDIHDNMKPFDFKIQVQNKTAKINQ